MAYSTRATSDLSPHERVLRWARLGCASKTEGATEDKTPTHLEVINVKGGIGSGPSVFLMTRRSRSSVRHGRAQVGPDCGDLAAEKPPKRASGSRHRNA
jgi:hypothetical protein